MNTLSGHAREAAARAMPALHRRIVGAGR